MKRAVRWKPCAYCGGGASTVDHVIPKALYPLSKSASRFQRITVDACAPCNNGWSADEPHFRNVMLLSGNASPVVRELWEGKTRRSLRQSDGYKRTRDLAAQLVPVETPDGPRHMIYPARDARVLRIARKIVRGLCHHHRLLSPIHDDQAFVDIQRFGVPPEFLAEMRSTHAEVDILTYRFGVLADHPLMHSGWILTFFGRTSFHGIVFRSPEARHHFENEARAETGT